MKYCSCLVELNSTELNKFSQEKKAYMRIVSQCQNNLTVSPIKDSQVQGKHLISFILIEK